MIEHRQEAAPQGRARGLYDEQLQRQQQEKKLLNAEAKARRHLEEVR